MQQIEYLTNNLLLPIFGNKIFKNKEEENEYYSIKLLEPIFGKKVFDDVQEVNTTHKAIKTKKSKEAKQMSKLYYKKSVRSANGEKDYLREKDSGQVRLFPLPVGLNSQKVYVFERTVPSKKDGTTRTITEYISESNVEKCFGKLRYIVRMADGRDIINVLPETAQLLDIYSFKRTTKDNKEYEEHIPASDVVQVND